MDNATGSLQPRKAKRGKSPDGRVNDAMTTFTELLEKEPSAIVRAVLGHWLFGFIHPYIDGNGRRLYLQTASVFQ